MHDMDLARSPVRAHDLPRGPVVDVALEPRQGGGLGSHRRVAALGQPPQLGLRGRARGEHQPAQVRPEEGAAADGDAPPPGSGGDPHAVREMRSADVHPVGVAPERRVALPARVADTVSIPPEQRPPDHGLRQLSELGYRHPTGPLRSTDLVGLDVRLAIAEYSAGTLGERFSPPQLLRDKVAAGELGRKTRRGFHVRMRRRVDDVAQ